MGEAKGGSDNMRNVENGGQQQMGNEREKSILSRVKGFLTVPNNKGKNPQALRTLIPAFEGTPNNSASSLASKPNAVKSGIFARIVSPDKDVQVAEPETTPVQPGTTVDLPGKEPRIPQAGGGANDGKPIKKDGLFKRARKKVFGTNVGRTVLALATATAGFLGLEGKGITHITPLGNNAPTGQEQTLKTSETIFDPTARTGTVSSSNTMKLSEEEYVKTTPKIVQPSLDAREPSVINLRWPIETPEGKPANVEYELKPNILGRLDDRENLEIRKIPVGSNFGIQLPKETTGQLYFQRQVGTDGITNRGRFTLKTTDEEGNTAEFIIQTTSIRTFISPDKEGTIPGLTPGSNGSTAPFAEVTGFISFGTIKSAENIGGGIDAQVHIFALALPKNRVFVRGTNIVIDSQDGQVITK